MYKNRIEEVTLAEEDNSVEKIKVNHRKDELIISVGERTDLLKFDTTKGTDIGVKQNNILSPEV